MGDIDITAFLSALQKISRNYTCVSFSMNEKHKNETKLTLNDLREMERKPPTGVEIGNGVCE